jgi:hypothetical protein
MLILIVIFIIYKYLNTSELYSNLDIKIKEKKSNKECSDKSINHTIFNYKLSELNQTKTPN